MKDRDFKMRERWQRKEQERFEKLEEKAMKDDLETKFDWLKSCDNDVVSSDKYQQFEEVKQRLLRFVEECRSDGL